MSNKEKAEKPVKSGKGKGIMLMLVGSLLMLGVGGGGAFAAFHFGLIGDPRVKEDNSPKLIRKGQEDPYAPKAEAGKDGPGLDVDGEGGNPYRTTYYNFTDEFTSNLKDSQSLIQVSLACSTHRDGRVVMWLKKHELAIRSAVLEVLADTPEEDINTIEGKDRLQKRLAAAINHVLTDAEGFGGVDAVYFKSFLVQ
jgi:flagellar FliL protein